MDHTWISDLMLAKCVSMAPPWGKFWFILFMSSVKQLKARASGERSQEKQSTPPLPKELEVPEWWSNALSWFTMSTDKWKTYGNGMPVCSGRRHMLSSLKVITNFPPWGGEIIFLLGNDDDGKCSVLKNPIRCYKKLTMHHWSQTFIFFFEILRGSWNTQIWKSLH